MMKIKGFASMIYSIWGRGKHMAAGGPASGGGSAATASTDIFDKMDRAVDALYAWAKTRAGDQAALDEMFAVFGDLIASGRLMETGFNEAVAAAVAAAKAGSDAVDEVERLAKASGNTATTVAAVGMTFKDMLDKLAPELDTIRGYLSQMPGVLGEVASAAVDLVQSIQSNNWGGIASAIGNIFGAFLREQLSNLQDKLASLNEQLVELRETESFFIDAMKTIGSTLSSVMGSLSALGPVGSMLSSVAQLVTGSFSMLKLEGIDLLNAGLATLSSFVTSAASIFMGLIERGSAYTAYQAEAESVWSSLGDAMGDFLWPLVGAVRYLKEWLGIQSDLNDTMTEVGVPSMWKRTRAAYESASPGQAVSGETAIPAWAIALGDKIGATIKEVLQGFGISSWGDVLTIIKDAAVSAWTWINQNLPAAITGITGFLGSVWSALTATYEWGVSLWNEVGGWSGIMAKWEEFKTTLGTLPSWSDLQAEMAKLLASIAGVEAAIKGVEAAIRLLAIVTAIASAALAIIQALGGLGGLVSGLGSLFGGGTAATVAATTTTGAATVAAVSGTPAQIAQLMGSGAGTIAKAAALAAVPVLVGTGAFDPFVQGTVKPWMDRNVAPVMHAITDPIGNIITGIAGGIKGFFNMIGFAGGGFVTSPTFAKIGEGGNAEGVFPLTQNTFDRFAQGIVASLTARTPVYAGAYATAGQAPMITNEIHVFIGEDEVTDLVVVKVGDRSRSLTGNRSSMAALNRRG